MSKQVYISGPLTNSNRKDFYEEIGRVVESLGYEPYIPHLHTDPEKNPDVTPEDVYVIEMMRVETSSLVIAYVGNPSLGVGAELERANVKGIPIILLYEKSTNVSRLIRGMNMVKAEISYEDENDALQKVASIISTMKHYNEI